MSVFTLEALGREYDGEPALMNINLSLGEQSLGVIGKSGSGKTTLLKILAGLLEPSHGKLSFKGTDVNAETLLNLRRRVTMVFQSPVFLKGTVDTNLSYGLRLRGVPGDEIETRVSDALSWYHFRAMARGTPGACQGASSRGSRLPGRSSLTRKSCCLTSPPATWTR